MSCITLSSISAAQNCVDYDNRGGVISKILLAYHDDVATFPELPSASGETGMTLAAAGAWSGTLAMKTGKAMVEINFLEGEGELRISVSGDRGARTAHYELEIIRSKINAETLGLLNACKDAPLIIIATDANGNNYLLGDKLVPCYMVEGDGAKSGRARTDRNQTTINFEYYGQRFLLYSGTTASLTAPAGGA